MTKKWIPLKDGRYIEDSIIDGKFILEISDNGEDIRLTGPDDLYEKLNLVPFKSRLCETVSETIWLDAPNTPGWWAFEGRWIDQVEKLRFECVYEVFEEYIPADERLWFSYNGKKYPTQLLVGRWCKLVLPWREK